MFNVKHGENKHGVAANALGQARLTEKVPKRQRWMRTVPKHGSEDQTFRTKFQDFLLVSWSKNQECLLPVSIANLKQDPPSGLVPGACLEGLDTLVETNPYIKDVENIYRRLLSIN